MSGRYKKVLSVLSVIFSLITVGIGSGIVGAADHPSLIRFLLTLVFQIQFLLSFWVAVIVFRDNKG